MPNRIIKESIRTSETVSALTDFEFRLWVGLIVSVDDAGRGDARPAIIKGLVFPLRDRVSVKDIDAALHGLAAKGCVSLYSVGGKPYFWFPTWTAHQRIRDSKPKYPGPEEADELRQYAASCGELPQVAASCGLNPNPNPNTNPNTNPKESSTRAKFVPPTLEEVTEYAQQRNSPVDPRKFWEYFNAGDWKDSKGQPVRNWKQKLLTWEKYDAPKKEEKKMTTFYDVAQQMKREGLV